MTPKRLLVPALALVLAVAVFVATPRADEGFWPYNGIPKAAIKAKFKFNVTDAWLSHLQLATVRFSGGTGSIISPDGLVLTNHHLGLGTAQRLSTPEKDLVKNGFYAATRADELKVPGMSLRVLQGIEDVTARVNAAIKPGMPAGEAVAARQKAIQSLQADGAAGTREVVSLYAGAVYNLYTYKVYTDVRLAFIVEYQAGFFGGDPDNFGYPRYCMDVSMFRLYENDRPASTPNYLRWSPTGTKESDLVFTTGHPGTTYRLNTLAHFKYRRDSTLAFAIASNEMREAATKKWMASSAENARQSTSDLFSIQNSLKNQRGQLKGLQDPAVMAKKEADEKRILAALAKDPATQKEYADALATIEKSLETARQLDAARNFITNAAGLNSQLFTQARAIVRAAYNPPAEGARAGQRGGQRGGGAPPAGGQRGGAAGQQVNVQREKINLAESLAFMQKFLGPNHEIVKLVLGDKTPDARATELIEKTRITDPEINALLRAGGRATVDVATDPMIALARALEPRAQEVEKRYAEEVTNVQSATYPTIGAAVLAVDGAKVSSDATGTLRLSYGTVKGYQEDGRKVPPYTYVPGLYERSAQHDNEKPYDLVPSWVAARSALDPKTPFDMVTTNDIVGGNSGSAMVDKKGELVGLVFDGNPPMLAGYYTYYEGSNRAISVDSRLILEALRKVYKAEALVTEIVGTAKKK
jgi:hypothetical protein